MFQVFLLLTFLWVSQGELGPIQPKGAGRVVGGSDAEVGEFPYQVSVQIRGIGMTYHACGGSILNNFFILTAAHCLFQQHPNSIHVSAGDHNLANHEGSEQLITGQELILHENYSVQSHNDQNDVGLIRLAAPLTFNYRVQPIALPNHMDLIEPGTMCTITGWGKVEEITHDIPEILQKAEVPIVSDDDCRASYGERVVDSMLCAGYPEGGVDTCQGDSGGPVACNGKVYGITSWGMGCAEAGYPGVYTEVAYFVHWIEKHIH